MTSLSSIGRTITIVLAGIYVLSMIFTVWTSPNGITTSADPNATTIPLWESLLPPLLGAIVVLLIPTSPPPARPADQKKLRLSTWLLIAIALAFTLAVMVVPLGDLYPFIKIALIMILAGIVVAILRPAVRVDTPRAAWRWWAPLAAAAVWFWFAELAPWTSTYNPGDIDVVLLIIGAVVTAISAGVGEELFYRRWLQTRLEALLGAWAGIAIASFLFAIMHLGSHSSGDFITDLTRVIAFQGSMGLFLGLMWWRYRNLWAIILVHLLANGWGVVVFLVG